MSETDIHALLIEDNPLDARLIREYLSEVTSTRVTLECAECLSDAVQRLREASPDVVLLDLGLPESQGPESLSRVQAEAPHIPVVVITGLDDEDVAYQAVSQGAQDYLVKSRVDGELLVRSMRYAIERNRAEDALKRSEERYRGLWKHVPIALWEEDLSRVKAHIEDLRRSGGKDLREYLNAHPEAVRECASLVELVDVNQATLDLYGAEGREDFKEGLPSILDGASYATFKEELLAIAEGRTHFVAETTARTLHGEERHLVLAWSVAPGFEDTLSRVLVSDIDITERKQAEEALQQLKAFHEGIVQTMGEGVIVLDQQGNVSFTNPTAAALLGYTPEELVGTHWTSFVPEDQQAIVQAADERRAQGQSDRYEVDILHRDGTRVTVLVSGSPRLADGALTGTLAVFTDITQLKKAQEEIGKLSQFQATIIDNANVWLNVLDEHANVVIWNKAAEQISGYSREEAVGHDKIWEWLYPEEDYRHEVHDRATAIVEGQDTNEADETTIRRKDGQARSIAWHLRQLVDQDGNPLGSVALGRDVTEQREAEEALRESEESYRQLANSITDVFFAMNTDLRYTFWNKASESLTGITAQDALGKSIFEIFPDTEDTARAAAAYQDVLRTQQPCTFISGFRLGDKDLFFEISAYPSGDGLSVFCKDVTARKRAEEELRQGLDHLRRTLEQTVHALAATIEVRDPYTAGHQRRVANLAYAIAREMALPHEKARGVHMAGLVHDIGKIQIPAEILSKPSALSEVEWRMIETHPQVGHEILNGIDFPWPVAQIVLQHHERLDGSGYPQGLRGDDILLEARILAVADVVEAMSSHRPYRPAHTLEAALEEIRSKSGTLYEPGVVNACLKVVADKASDLGLG